MNEGHNIGRGITSVNSEYTESTEEQTFLEAAEWFVAMVDTIPDDAWSGPGLGEWDLRALVGHTSRALSTVMRGIAQPAAEIDCETAADYVVQTAAIQAGTARADDGSSVTERGVAAGRALGEQPADAVRVLLEDTRSALRGVAPQDPIITTIVGGMRLSQYLRTRTFELVVHGLDIQAALRRRPAAPKRSSDAPPAAALALSLDHTSQVALLRGEGAAMLLALTGRNSLEDGYSVLAPSTPAGDA